MAAARPPLRFGLTLGIRLFLLLIAIIAPVLMTYYVQTFSAFESRSSRKPKPRRASRGLA